MIDLEETDTQSLTTRMQKLVGALITSFAVLGLYAACALERKCGLGL